MKHSLKKSERVGVVEILTVRSHANRLYLPLSRSLCRAFDIRRGDQLRVEIKEIVRRAEE